VTAAGILISDCSVLRRGKYELKSPYKISKEVGVSPQAVYKKLTDEFINQFNNHIQRTTEGKYLLNDVAETALKELFNHVVQPVQQHKVELVEQQLLNQLSTENSFLRDRVEDLEKELETERTHNREQTDKLFNLATQLAELTKNNQLLLGAEQSRTNPALLMGSDPPKQGEESQDKKGFFQRIFERHWRLRQ